MIYLIDDDEIMMECLENSIGKYFNSLKIKKFTNAISAIHELNEDEQSASLPSLILLDIMLTGPDGFTFLNELASYPSTQKIPIIIISSLDFSKYNLKNYNIVKNLDKSKFTPEELIHEVSLYVS